MSDVEPALKRPRLADDPPPPKDENQDAHNDNTDSDSIYSSSDSSLGDVEEVDGWRLLGVLSEGNNGRVYLGVRSASNEHGAVKLETRSPRHSHITVEADCLQKLSGEVGFPRALDRGTRLGRHWLAMELLGPSVDDLDRQYELCDHTIRCLGYGMLLRLQALHTHGFVHHSVKPDNFCLGFDTSGDVLVYLIDFGRCESYRTADGAHITDGKNVGGPYSRWYHSRGALHGNRQSRRDDLESLGYTFVFLLKGSPFRRWRERVATPDDPVVHHYRGELPVWLTRYLEYVTTLDFAADPDYAHLLGLLRSDTERDARCGKSQDLLRRFVLERLHKLQSQHSVVHPWLESYKGTIGPPRTSSNDASHGTFPPEPPVSLDGTTTPEVVS